VYSGVKLIEDVKTMRSVKKQIDTVNQQGSAGQEADLALGHLINVLKILRDECAAMPSTLINAQKLDLRPLFFALRKVEEMRNSKRIDQLVYRREQVLEMTGWSRTTLWRRCKSVGISLGRDVFTPEEIILLVKRKRSRSSIEF
jgi:DNA-binding NtrC family response regulator